MSSWLMSIGWLRFTVPSSTAETLKRVLGEGDWIRDEKGYEGYREVWICRGTTVAMAGLPLERSAHLAKSMSISPKS